MKIQKIAIKDFKNFQATQTFDLSHQYIIIKGDNGVGKTSIFDAIFWVFTGNVFNSSMNGWKPKTLLEENGESLSVVKDRFNTEVELTFRSDNLSLEEWNKLSPTEQEKKLVTIKRTSNGDGATVYLNGRAYKTQKEFNNLLKDFYDIDINKLWIYCNPEILFDKNYTSQKEARDLIYNAVSHVVKAELADLKSQMFALYETDITDLREQLSESIGSEKERLENDIRIAEKLLNQTKHYLLKLDENETLLKLEDDKAKNLDNIHAQTISISQQEPSLKDYYESRGQQSAYNDLEKKLDSADSKLRQLEYKLEQNEKDVVPFKDNIRKLENQLDKINKFISENHSPRELRQFFGITVKPIPGEVKPAIKPLPKLTLEKIKCQVCGNMYYPTIDAKQQEEHKIKEAQVKAENEKAELEARKETEKLKAELPDNEPFDYSIHVNQIKEQINQQKDGMKVYTIKELDIKDEISKLDYQTQDEIQKERKAVSVFKIRIQMGEKTLRNIEKLKADCLDLELTNKYLTILHDELLKFVKDKLSLIGSKLNSHLTVGKISLFKLQSNGVLKENFSIIDKHSNAAFEETNTAAKKKLGIEVCLLLQKFNKIFLPIFVDEIQQFANINWIYDITEHQLLATMPSKSNVIDIVFDD